MLAWRERDIHLPYGQPRHRAWIWGVRRLSWLQVGASGGHLGSKLGGLGAILAPSCGVWGPSWLQVGASGAILAPSWGVWGHLGSKLEGPRGIWAPNSSSWLQVGVSESQLGAKSENDLQRSLRGPPPGTRFLRHLPRGLLIFISG